MRLIFKKTTIASDWQTELIQRFRGDHYCSCVPQEEEEETVIAEAAEGHSEDSCESQGINNSVLMIAADTAGDDDVIYG